MLDFTFLYSGRCNLFLNFFYRTYEQATLILRNNCVCVFSKDVDYGIPKSSLLMLLSLRKQRCFKSSLFRNDLWPFFTTLMAIGFAVKLLLVINVCIESFQNIFFKKKYFFLFWVTYLKSKFQCKRFPNSSDLFFQSPFLDYQCY